MRQKLFDHIKKKYKVKPEYPWRKYGIYAIRGPRGIPNSLSAALK